MNPHLLLTALKAAYNNRDEAAKLISKIKEWRNTRKEDSAGESRHLSTEERLERLESQSELLLGLATDVADLSRSTETLVARTRFLLRLSVLSLCLSVTALIVSLS